MNEEILIDLVLFGRPRPKAMGRSLVHLEIQTSARIQETMRAEAEQERASKPLCAFLPER